MENSFVAKACNADLCAADGIAQKWREVISLGSAIRDYEIRNKKNPLTANERANQNR